MEQNDKTVIIELVDNGDVVNPGEGRSKRCWCRISRNVLESWRNRYSWDEVQQSVGADSGKKIDNDLIEAEDLVWRTIGLLGYRREFAGMVES